MVWTRDQVEGAQRLLLGNTPGSSGGQRGHKGRTKLGNCPEPWPQQGLQYGTLGTPDKEQAWLPSGAPPQPPLIVQERYLPPTRVLPFHPRGQWPGASAREPMSKTGGLQLDGWALPRSGLSSLYAKAVFFCYKWQSCLSAPLWPSMST